MAWARAGTSSVDVERDGNESISSIEATEEVRFARVD